MLTDTTVGDVVVMITGGRDFRRGENQAGVAPDTDAGNAHDEIVWVFGATIDESSVDADHFVNAVARTISHEMGHAFGLKHVPIDPTNDAMSHLLMGVPTVVGVEDRDFDHDFNFQDMLYPAEGGGTQNSHQYLSSTLGASSTAWAAVLKPGVLTVRGTEGHDTIEIASASSKKLVVTINGVSSSVDHFSPGLDSLNPFDAPLTLIGISSKGGNDTITISTALTIETSVFAGSGNDTVFGGGGLDMVFGELGSDTIFGRGGNDYLYGGANNDFLYGDGGLDYLFGEAGNDRLDGGKDGIRDLLFGGADADTFVAERYSNGVAIYPYYNRDLPEDFNSLQGDYLDWGFYFTSSRLVQSGAILV
jgi:Ca2+-binding RTX toxin-like protein